MRLISQRRRFGRKPDQVRPEHSLLSRRRVCIIHSQPRQTNRRPCASLASLLNPNRYKTSPNRHPIAPTFCSSSIFQSFLSRLHVQARPRRNSWITALSTPVASCEQHPLFHVFDPFSRCSYLTNSWHRQHVLSGTRLCGQQESPVRINWRSALPIAPPASTRHLPTRYHGSRRRASAYSLLQLRNSCYRCLSAFYGSIRKSLSRTRLSLQRVSVARANHRLVLHHFSLSPSSDQQDHAHC